LIRAAAGTSTHVRSQEFAMTDTDDIDEQPAVPPTPPFDAFTAVANLLALIADERGCQARICELKAQIDAAEKAMRKLEIVRASHDKAIAKDRAEIAAERSDLVKRQTAAMAAEAKLAEWKEKIVAFQYSQRGERDTRRYEPLPGGGSRDWGPDGMYRDDAPRPLDDPHYDPSPSAAAAETETVLVPGEGHSLTRSIPRPRKSMRRVPEPPNAA
jgi:hypothetical protein